MPTTWVTQCVIFFVFLVNLQYCSQPRTTTYNDDSIQSRVKSQGFIGLNMAWFVDTHGDLFITRNQGENWTVVPGDKVGGRFESAGFLAELKGFAVSSEGVIWGSIDGGESWKRVSQLISTDTNQWRFTSSSQITFADELHGWLLETFTVWRTEDGGKEWMQVSSVLDGKSGGQPRAATFKGQNECWMVTTKLGRVYNSKDGGKTWNEVLVGGSEAVTDLVFPNVNTGFIATHSENRPYAILYRTDDGGKSWRSLAPLAGDLVVYSISFMNESRGWVVGRTWKGDPTVAEGSGWYTSDGGRTWRQLELPKELAFYRVHFSDPQHGWLFGHDHIYYTDDGLTWKPVFTVKP